MKPLLDHIATGENDPPEIISHRTSLEEAPTNYDMFEREKDEYLKVIMTP